MDSREKTRFLLDVLDRRSIIAPRSRPPTAVTSRVSQVSRKTSFSIFNRAHSKAASDCMKLLLGARDFESFMDVCGEILEYENDGLFLYAFYFSVRHRSDCVGLTLPPIEERSPHWFFAAETIHEAIQKSIHEPNVDHLVENRKTALDSESESRLAYYREDIGMNRHHWYWHVIYPFVWDEREMGKPKDRKGEFFYYMHQQMVARYDCERLSNGFDRVWPLDNFQEELPAYSPHMTSQTTGVHLPFRPEGLKLKNISKIDRNAEVVKSIFQGRNEQGGPSYININLRDMEMWRSRILKSIDQGYVTDASGNRISLKNEEGINVLGDIIEASSDSVNPDFYGDFHNLGHLMFANVEDPDGRFRQEANVMAYIEAAARDPVFYRYHKSIDNIFQRHKASLTPYTRDELCLNGIRFVCAEVQGKRKNIMETFMRESRSDLSNAPFLKTNKKRKILVKYEHLDHEPLTFVYNIENTTRKDKDVTVRVFLAPKCDEVGNPLKPNEQRLLMIELDKIGAHLKPGMNTVTRKDSESSVTVKRQIRSYRALQAGNVEPEEALCTCGWPEYMLIPKGTTAGMDFNLFAMCTDYDDDKPDASHHITTCSGAISYCGSRDAKYPDKKPMGFPFDRRINTGTMKAFLTSNMFLADVKIKFVDQVQPPTEWVIKMYENETF